MDYGVVKKRVVLTILFVTTFIWNQKGLTSVPSSGFQYKVVGMAEGGRVTVSGIKGDSIVNVSTFNPDEEIDVIVQFKTPAVGLGKSKNSASSHILSQYRKIESEHDLFFSNLNELNSTYASHSLTVVRNEYKMAINGVALRTTRRMVEAMEQLPVVREIVEDKEVFSFDDQSNDAINADAYWSEFGLKGEDIVIGILDTGVDYLHEALGGTAFPNVKVIGGYDVINKDADPMDDNGHGTHVAAIAAGDGPLPIQLQGVAPKAKIMAFKVLDKNGRGTFSQVIEGIERALNPDGNPETDDAVDIINLSLGGSGDPDDVISQAVDNASSKGVLCVVAAGNSGPGYFTIASPGNARKALTVGAVSNTNSPSTFSSRGPSKKVFGIKPDLTAPGVQINSAKSGGGYLKLSGTSMATPHVSGAAALLLQLHPDWEPMQVKAALMASAEKSTGEIWSQGQGKINLINAGNMQSVLTPASVNFGLDDPTQPIWQSSDTLWLSNYSSTETKTFTFSTQSSQKGVNIEIIPSVVSVEPNASVSVIAVLSVDNGQVPFSASLPTYTGTINARSLADSSEQITVPFSFAKDSRLDLTFDTAPWIVVIHNDSDKYYFLPYPGKNVSLSVPAGVYDVLVRYAGAFRQIVREKIPVYGPTPVTLLRSEAEYAVTLSPLDARSFPAAFGNYGLTQFTSKRSGFGITTAGALSDSSNYSVLFFSQISSHYRFQVKLSSFISGPDAEYYEFPFDLCQGISTSIILQNDPGVFTSVRYSYAHPQESLELSFVPYYYRPPSATQAGFCYNTVFPLLTTPYKIRSPFKMTGYYLPSPSNDFMVNHSYQDVYDITSGIKLLYTTSNSTVSPDGMFTIGPEENPIIATETNVVERSVGNAPPLWNGKLSVTGSSTVSLSPQTNRYHGLFLSPLADLFADPVTYTIWSAGAILSTGNIDNKTTFTNPKALTVTPGPSVIDLQFKKYFINNTEGKAIAKLSFNTMIGDKNPPYIERFEIKSDGIGTDVISPFKQNDIILKFRDNIGISSANIFLRQYLNEAESVWTELGVNSPFDSLRVALPANLAGGMYSLRINVSDPGGNTLEYTVEPAFAVGSISFTGEEVQFDNTQVGSISTDSVSIVNSTGTDIQLFLRGANHDEFVINSAPFYLRAGEEIKYPASFAPLSSGSKTDTICLMVNGDIVLDTLLLFGSAMFSRSISLDAEWNLLSNPLITDNDSIAYLLQNTIDQVAYSYNHLQSYVQSEVMEHGKGYWVKSPGPASFDIHGTPRNSDTIAVHAGWNLVGSITETIPVKSIEMVGTQIQSPFYQYSSHYSPSDSIRPGKAYWVLMESEGKLILSSDHNSAKAMPAMASFSTHNADNNAIEFTDARNRHQTLYISSDTSDLGSTYLPPLPPRGSFDIRYASQRMVEVFNSKYEDTKDIQYTGVSFPLTLEWNFGSDKDRIFTLLVVSNDGQQREYDITGHGTVKLNEAKLISLRSVLKREHTISLPEKFELSQNYPNPFNPATKIEYALPVAEQVTLKIYNMMGQEVAVLVNGIQEAGYKVVSFEASGMSSGMYFYKLTAGPFSEMKKMVLVK